MKLKSFIKENWFLILAIIYVISPFDFIPEALAPILGPFVMIDDAGILFIELVRRILGRKKKSINKLEEIINEEKKV